MNSFLSSSFEVGATLQIHGRRCSVLAVNMSECSIKVEFQGEIPQDYSMPALLGMYLDEALIFSNSNVKENEKGELTALSEKQRYQIESRIPYVLPLFDEQSPTKHETRKRIAEDALRKNPTYPRLSGNKQYLCFRRMKNTDGSLLSLLDPVKSKNNNHIQDTRAKSVVDFTFENRFMKKLESTYSQKNFLEDVNKKIKEMNLSIPSQERLPPISQPTMSRWLAHKKSVDPERWIRCRLGLTAARRAFRGTGQQNRPFRILDRAQFDFTPLDLVVIDAEYMIMMGKPTLGTLIDSASGSLLGFAVSFGSESTHLAAKVLRNATLPKRELVSGFESIKCEWNCYGLPLEICVDLGSAFISKAFLDMCLLLTIDKIDTPAASPWLKPLVESQYSTMGRGLLSNMPSHTKMDRNVRSLVEKGVCPAVSLESFYEILLMWICDIYQRTPHGVEQITPHEYWDQQVELFPPRLPSSVAKLDIALGMVASPKLQDYGIQINSLRYSSKELMNLRLLLHGKDNTVKIKWHPDNLEFIHVYDHVKDIWIRVSTTYKKYASGLNIWKHKQYRSMINSKSRAINTSEELMEAKARHASLIEETKIRIRRGSPYQGVRNDRETLKSHLVQSGDLPVRQDEINSMKGAIMKSSEISDIEQVGIMGKMDVSHTASFDWEVFGEIEE
jgi:putative transposase